MRIILRILINAVALWAAASVIDGITLSSDLVSILIVALAFGIVNAFVRPLAQLLSFPFIVVTLGLFTLVINAAMLLLTDFLTDRFDVDGFFNAVLGSLVISLVSWVFSLVLTDA